MGTHLHDVLLSSSGFYSSTKGTIVSSSLKASQILTLIEDTNLEEETSTQEDHSDRSIGNIYKIVFSQTDLRTHAVLFGNLSKQIIRNAPIQRAKGNIPLYIHFMDLRI